MFGRATIRLGIGPHSSFVCSTGSCMTEQFLLIISVVRFNGFIHYSIFSSVRQIKLATRQLLATHKYSLLYCNWFDLFTSSLFILPVIDDVAFLTRNSSTS